MFPVRHHLSRCIPFALFITALHAAPGFSPDIQPILKARCTVCHHGAQPAAGLKMDTLDDLLKGGTNGPAIIPAASSKSPLLQRIIAADKSNRMPPSGDPLTTAEIALITQWIDSLPPTLVSSKVDFDQDVKPLLEQQCYECHSAARASSQLRLDNRELALQGGLSGPVILPGDASHSRLLQRVQGLGGVRRMPLGKSPLTAPQIAILNNWINQGAIWPGPAVSDSTTPKHWAYIKPIRPTPPATNNPPWVRNPIDAFLLARLQKEGLTPSPEASKETLIRRATLDLTGLPPTLDEVEAFKNDTRPDAYEKVVDRLLASPHYGERWARPWLDAARYADTNGFEKDVRRTMWKYRDWVINAYNSNMPFDQFTLEQIAGDMLPNATVDQKIASGFNRNTMFNEEGGVDPAESHYEVLIDRVNTTSTVWLGSTIGCSQCHNHKFDPFTQKGYFQMMAFFDNSSYTPVEYGDTSIKWQETTLELPTPAQETKRKELKSQIETIEAKLKTQTPALQAEQRIWEAAMATATASWQPLTVTKATSTGGATLDRQPDGSYLAKGDNPSTDAYIFEGKSLLPQLTAVRVEALPDPSLPRGGPGRDVYGNFILTDFIVEIAPANAPSQWTRLDDVEFKADNGRIGKRTKDDRQIWSIDASREDSRLSRQLLLIPSKPFGYAGGTLLRITLTQYSEYAGVAIGKLRLGVTAATNPQRTVELSHSIRPLLAKTSRTPDEEKRISDSFRTVAKSLEANRKKLTLLRDQLRNLGMATALVMQDNPTWERPSTFFHPRGAFLNKAERVYANTPAVFPALAEDQPANRLGLAKWLVSKDNPLTARVIINRIWETYFGRGIVETTEDFGSQGERPFHPELLDWLAVEFMDSGWDLKHMHRLIVTSSAYRQSSVASPELLEKDPYNRLLARGSRFRLEGELIRDNALAISGLLTDKVGGPSVMPYQPEGVWDVPYSSDRWVISKGGDQYRRGLYTFWRRSSPFPLMVNFDAPSREQCTVRRTRTNTPLQALNTLNDPAFFEAAQALAKRIIKEAPTDDASRIAYAFKLCTQRDPSPKETEPLLQWLAQERTALAAQPSEASKIAGSKTPDPGLAAWTMVANVLLNLDETMTRE